MSIEQRAHEAAMAHLRAIGNVSSDHAKNAYTHIYQGIIDDEVEKYGGHEKALENAIHLERLHQEGLMASRLVDLRKQVMVLTDDLADANVRLAYWEEKKWAGLLGEINKKPWWKLW